MGGGGTCANSSQIVVCQVELTTTQTPINFSSAEELWADQIVWVDALRSIFLPPLHWSTSFAETVTLGRDHKWRNPPHKSGFLLNVLNLCNRKKWQGWHPPVCPWFSGFDMSLAVLVTYLPSLSSGPGIKMIMRLKLVIPRLGPHHSRWNHCISILNKSVVSQKMEKKTVTAGADLNASTHIAFALAEPLPQQFIGFVWVRMAVQVLMK